MIACMGGRELSTKNMSKIIVILLTLGIISGCSKKNYVEKATIPSERTRTSQIKEIEQRIPKWDEPSVKEYPKIKNPSALSILVSIKEQKVYIKEQKDIICTLFCSTGESKLGNATPKGNFFIEKERGESLHFDDDDTWVYNWISFSGHGVYLFHSVLMLNEDTVEPQAGKSFGKEASHGCVRLSLPDSRWFYEHIVTGTPVMIE